ncbi:LAFE_0H14070g1_1 [Lachancea fermentati]|uniref:Large ribosomal subunit protein mL50 n=1 Tax=Lachancea fermentati TaxID=4955 RepID=A0A1G4MKU6_LACFM|nr:LAFE_0H14070g1_1 [Lachancea fermentati]
MLTRTSLSLKSTRSLHMTPASNDFMSWFKRKQTKNTKDVIPTAKDTREVIDEIESGKMTINNVSKLKLKLAEEDFIGEEPGQVNLKNRLHRLETVPFNKWLSKRQVASLDDLDLIILRAYKDFSKESGVISVTNSSISTPFPDLVSKFFFTKSLQAQTGVLIPDYQLTKLSSPMSFRNYFIEEILSGKQAKYNELEPNAIHIDEETYSAASVYVVKDVKQKDLKKKLGRILSEVETLERESAKKAIERAKH